MDDAHMQLWVLARPDQMKDHRFTDDVAITYAFTKEEAISKFSRYYADIQPSEVRSPYFNQHGVAILTDY